MREGRDNGARYGDVPRFCLSVVDDDLASEGEQEKDQRDAELDAELGAVSLAEFTVCGGKR